MLSGHALGDASGRLLAFDSQVCEILQQREGELLGKSYRDFTHPDDVTRNTHLLDRLRTGEGPIEFTKRYLRPGGSSVLVRLRVSRVEGSDGGRLLSTIELLPQAGMLDVGRRWQAARRAAGALRLRRAELGADLVGDLAYALLLEIYLVEAEGRWTAFDQLVSAVGASRTIVRRWLDVLCARELVEMPAGSPPQLTLEGVRKVERLLDVTSGG